MNPSNYCYYNTAQECMYNFIKKLIRFHVFLNGNKRTAAVAEHLLWERYATSVYFHNTMDKFTKLRV